MLHCTRYSPAKESAFGCYLIPVSAKKDTIRPSGAPDPSASTSERRRIGRIVRDDRDTASVEWVDAPADYARVPLSIEGTLPPGVRRPPGGGYNPYETIAPQQGSAPPAADKRPVRRDLRKLSAWIKQMRELEERKKRGED
jgi:hypothetical protein